MDEAHVVVLDLRGEDRIFLSQCFIEELHNIWWVNFSTLLWEADCGQEIARVDLQVVVEDD